MLLRINLILLAAFAFTLVAISLVVTSMLEENATREVLAQASLMLDRAQAIRSYTETEVGPLLDEKMLTRVEPLCVPVGQASISLSYGAERLIRRLRSCLWKLVKLSLLESSIAARTAHRGCAGGLRLRAHLHLLP